MWEVLYKVDKKHDWCRCACGKEKKVRRDHRRAALSTQCGSCRGRYQQSDLSVEKEPRTLVRYTAEQREIKNVAKEAKHRCTNARHKHYKDYGGRGITFDFADVASCVLWIIDNLGPRPLGLTLDRIDNNRGYAPGNLRWVTYAEQNENKRTANGENLRRKLAKV